MNISLKKYYAIETVELNPGVGGAKITVDDLGVDGKVEVVKVAYGAEGAMTLVEDASPMPVKDTVAEAALTSIAAEDFATHAAQTDSSQKTQIVDAAGNPVTVTGNKLDVNATFSGDIEIGAVEIKNATTDDRTAVINIAPTTEFGLVTRNIPSGTQPVSGTFFQATQPVSGTFFQATQPVSAAALPLPTGAATEATQLLVKADVDKIPSQGQAVMAASMPVVIASNQSAIPVSGTVAVTGAGDATAANQVTGNNTLAAIDAGIPAGLGQTTMANSMPVVLASNQSSIPVTFSGSPAVDNTSLYSATLSATGAITGIDTTGYESLIIQFSGTWTGNLIFEGSLDNSIWSQLLVKNVNELSMQDLVVNNGIYQLKATSKFIRINVFQITGSITALILGRIGTGVNAADMLSFAMDKNNNTPLYVSEVDSRKDNYKALIPSDAPTPIYGFGTIVNAIPLFVDTTGYQAITIQLFGTWVGNLDFQCSNDGNSWVRVGGNQVSGIFAGNANGVIEFPTPAKFFRVIILAYTSGVIQMLAYLRQQNGMLGQNISKINGTAVDVNASAGTLPISGNTAPGAALNQNPLPISGVQTPGGTNGTVRNIVTDSTGRLIVSADSTSTSRIILTDTSGRIITSVTDQSGTARPLGGLSPSSNPYNVASLAVQDVGIYEGMSQTEINGEMLKELKLISYYLSELPTLLNLNNNKFDEPQVLRNDPTFYTN